MILAPHQDDELILCGSFLKELTEETEVYIVFTTNGNYEASVHTIRLVEALKVCSLYGVKEDHVIFLGYANEYDISGSHIYNAVDGGVVRSKYGIDMTYGLPSHPEYCYKKNGIHHSYTRYNMKQDLFDVVSEIMPDVIFATDMEIHPDHKCNSLLLDEVLGEILKLFKEYKPIVLKKPGYMTSWFSNKDYEKINNAAAKLNYSVVRTNGHRSVFDNPYIKWSDRIRIPVGASTRDCEIEDNILYKALGLYKSQNAVSHFEMMQNSDVVFWQRRTDSLSYRAKVEVSSGNGSYLNDFKIVDSSDIKRKANEIWNADASIWRPDLSDKERRIDFYLEKREVITDIYIYQEYYPKSKITKAHLLIEDKYIAIGELNYCGVTKVKLNSIIANKITLFIDAVSNENVAPGITEIEIFCKKSPELLFAKLMIRNNFVYDYYVKEDEIVRLQVYEYWSDGSTKVTSIDEYNITISQSDGGQDLIIKDGQIMGAIRSKSKIYIKNCRYNNIRDTITLLPYATRLDASKKSKNILDELKSLLKKMVNEEVGIYCGRYADKFASLSYGEKRNNMSWFVKEFVRGYICEDYKYKKRDYRKIFFLGAPDHGNLGDHAITIATYAILNDILGGIEIEEVSIMNFARKLPYLIKNIQKNDLIVLQGGGNMGNVYWRNERIRREIITRFPDNIKIVFPETIFYENNEEGKKDFEISKQVYKNEKTYIFARESQSYEIMRKAYPISNVYLVPDIVCYFAPYPTDIKSEGVGLCIRNDIEKGIPQSLEENIKTLLDSMNEKYAYLDMMYNSKGYIGRANRDRLVNQKIKEISSFKYIITDRLHGMILSYITGTPCIVISRYNHKIQSFYETWFKDIDYIRFIYDEGNLKDEMDYISTLEDCNPEIMNYEKLINILEDWI